jgi:phosphoglycolate phosphatase-like HAD superfamily hydrolase
VRSSIFKKSISSIRLQPGAKELLQFFDKIGASWAIASSGDRSQVEQLLKDFHIPSRVPIITGDDVATAKPAPDSFVLAAQRMRALGVGLLCGGYSESELERAGAYRVYEDPGDLLAHLEELGIQTE